jgi:hypothetical protein
MTTTLPERATLPAVPALEPEDGRRAVVREWRRELAEWLRAYGVTPTGEPWELVTTGERDLATIRQAAHDAGTLAKHWAGTLPPAAIVAGDMTDYGQAVGVPITDPETGGVWLTVRRVTSGPTDHDVVTMTTVVSDHEVRPGELLAVSRGKGNR